MCVLLDVRETGSDAPLAGWLVGGLARHQQQVLRYLGSAANRDAVSDATALPLRATASGAATASRALLAIPRIMGRRTRSTYGTGYRRKPHLAASVGCPALTCEHAAGVEYADPSEQGCCDGRSHASGVG